MLADFEKEYIQNHYQQLAKHQPDFVVRAAQKCMIDSIAEVFARHNAPQNTTQDLRGDHILVVEGPAGVGKSLAYLIAGGVLARMRRKKLVISTATIALQEQLIRKDLPMAFQYSDQPITYALAKGRRRYVCPYRLYQHTIQPTLPDLTITTALWDHKLKPADVTLLHALSDAFQHRKWCGDLDVWPQSIDVALLPRITNDRHGCRKDTCPNRAECPFFLAREQLKKVDVLVVNHDLLLADGAMGGGIILPPLENSFYCIDEAHHLYKKAINQFSSDIALKQGIRTLEKISALLPAIAIHLKKRFHIDEIQTIAHYTEQSLVELLFTLENNTTLASYEDPEKTMLLFEEGVVPDALHHCTQNLALLSKQLFKALHTLSDTINQQQTKTHGTQLDRISDNFGILLSYVDRMQQLWELFDTPVDNRQKPIAKWISRQNDYWFCAAPTDVAHHLKQILWRRPSGILLTSATLRALGTFDIFLQQTGLFALSGITCLALDSPFNFANQGELYLPNILANPKNIAEHTAEVILWLPKLIDLQQAVGTLVLFASQKQMHTVAKQLDACLRAHLLVQGNMTKACLLEKHAAQLAANKPSIIFGLDSFAEGLDLPGKSCVQVIIAKLPFTMPNNPIDRTLSRWVIQQGKDPFLEIAMPEASLKLLQAVGRLLRTESDYGRVTILDHRTTRQPYGRKLLEALPPFKRVKI
ncbi:MAG: ATP-dependent DNA helicase DinG [Neisseriales bacterium]|nr:MAG: ATP-dependent DNA helicase DinG [Neisseriales bacterium]